MDLDLPETPSQARIRGNLFTAEAALDFDPVPVGSVPWLPLADWSRHAVVTRSRRRVRIVLISAREPGTGAFRRLISGIRAAGLKPVVVCPLGHMEAILKRWGWKRRRANGDWEWMP